MPQLPDLLDGAPSRERSLLELRAIWPDLPEAHARVAARLRAFVLNWDPLYWMRESFEASATATGNGDSFELVLYAPLRDAPEPLGDLSRSVLDVAVEQELLLVSGAYAQLAFAGKVPDLLSATGALSLIDVPQFEPAAGGWEPIGLGAIQDLVQAQCGPVDLDRTAVTFEPVADPETRCPACGGQRFGFPELAEAQAAMCWAHAQQAAEITAGRLARAEAGNRDGWRAIVDASSALGEPTYGLPLELLARLDDATDRVDPTLEELRADAATALELARELRGRPDDLDAWAEDWPTRDWTLELPWQLHRHGMIEDAVRVADAFAELDREQRSVFANDAAVMLARRGRVEDARARIAANLEEFPRDIWTHVHTGDVYQTLGDVAAAEREFRHAAALAQTNGDQQDRSIIAERLCNLLTTVRGRESDAAEAATAAKVALAAEHGQRIAAKTGRNDRCPCGSGRKYKKCCGA